MSDLSQLVWATRPVSSTSTAPFELELLSVEDFTASVEHSSEDLPPSTFTVEDASIVTEGTHAHCRRMAAVIRATGSSSIAMGDFVRCLAACGFSFQNGRATHTHDASGASTRERMYPALHEAVYGTLVEAHGAAVAASYLQGPLWMSSEGRAIRSCHLEPGVLVPEGSQSTDWVAREPVTACCVGLPTNPGVLVIDEDRVSVPPPSPCSDSLERAAAVVEAVSNASFQDLFPELA